MFLLAYVAKIEIEFIINKAHIFLIILSEFVII